MQDLVTSLLKKQISDSFKAKASSQLGLKTEQTESLTEKALPLLLTGLAKNADTKSGAQSLLSALQKPKHDGSVLGQLDTLLKSPESGEGPGILKHVLGETREDVAQALAGDTGANQDQTKKMMMVLAPMVMGALGKAVRSEKLSAEQLGALLQVVRKDKTWAGKADALATKFLDKDKDGNYKDDLFNMAKNFVGKMMSKK